jgi:hypothetical protein
MRKAPKRYTNPTKELDVFGPEEHTSVATLPRSRATTRSNAQTRGTLRKDDKIGVLADMCG